MRGPIRSILLAALAACALGALTAGSASAAYMKEAGVTPGFLAIYAFPGANNEAERPVGAGIGRNFGFGENMLFRASTPAEVGKNLKITVLGKTLEARDSYLGGTLMSNRTGANRPLSLAIQFVDFQASQTGTEAIASYADTHDRPWIGEICSPAAEESKCKTDDQFTEPVKKGGVKIENVSIDLGPGLVVQGSVWGEWKNGAAKKAPCISLKLPAAGNPTLVVTQVTGETEIGKAITAIEGEACLISANNNWYHAGTVINEPAIEITNE
jgi:hypothetical protein